MSSATILIATRTPTHKMEILMTANIAVNAGPTTNNKNVQLKAATVRIVELPTNLHNVSQAKKSKHKFSVVKRC